MSASGGVLFSFPSGVCPSGVVPARSWRSGSFPSGSWSSLALAVGLDMPCLVWLPSGVVAPSWLCPVGLSFGGGRWFASLPF
ncbi:hypothetical protein [Geminocystis sp. NIES-3709]|uniref:hypothetical protein n=1 Tax=Geminocystis sp. NIES-3709 TaxID=1617448 RepID=UPI00118739D5|nr:hypothetical protein [Geminocystis sp. NIES-3709]